MEGKVFGGRAATRLMNDVLPGSRTLKLGQYWLLRIVRGMLSGGVTELLKNYFTLSIH